MKKINENIKNIKKIKLTESEREISFNKIMDYADFKSGPETSYKNNKTEFSIFYIFSSNRTVSLVLSAFLIMILGSGTSFAAERALPGDILYPVKTRVNEKLVGAFVFDQEKDVEWEIEKIERRLEEAQELAMRGELDSENRIEIKDKISDHLEDFNKKINNFKEENGLEEADIRVSFDSKIKTHIAIINGIKEEGLEQDDSAELGMFIEDVDEELEESSKKNFEEINEYIDSGVSLGLGGDRKNKNFVDLHDSLEEALSNLKEDISGSDVSLDNEDMVLLSDSEILLEESALLFEEGDSKQAHKKLLNARLKISRLEVLIERYYLKEMIGVKKGDSNKEEQESKKNAEQGIQLENLVDQKESNEDNNEYKNETKSSADSNSAYVEVNTKTSIDESEPVTKKMVQPINLEGYLDADVNLDIGI